VSVDTPPEPVRVRGLDGPVEVVRDEWGIPHVRAGTTHDAFFGQGFVQAADRLGQLEYDRRRALGRWAEVAGPGAAPFDVFARRCGLRDAARREYAALTPEARSVLDAYAAGVNAWLALDRPLPPDLALAGVTPEPWEPWHANAVFLVRHVVFANWQKKLWRARVARALGADAAVRLERDDRPVPLIVPPDGTAGPFALDPADAAPVVAALDVLAAADPDLFAGSPRDGRWGEPPDTGSDGGSNAWVVSGARTASGAPILAGDPHRQVETPGVYVQNHLACPEFDAIGLAFVGVPGFPHFGHSAHVAWAVTNAYGDYQDLFVERFAPGHTPDRVERVEVRGAAPIEVRCHETVHGPVVFGDPATGAAIAMHSTAIERPSGGLEVVAPMCRARSVEELREVMRAWVDPANNFVMADVDGGIGYQTTGRFPVRNPANAWGPVPGWDPAFTWTGDVAHDALPAVATGTTTMIVTANQRIVGDDWPDHLSDGYSRPDRAQRIHDLLADRTDLTVADMAAIHRDVASGRADVWRDRIAALTPTEPIERSARDLVVAWDGRMAADSAAAAVVMVVRDAVGRILAHVPGLADLRTPFAGEPPGAFVPVTLRLWVVASALLADDDRTFLPAGADWNSVLADALADGVGVLRTRLGDDPAAWRWGDLHVSAPHHPLAATDPAWAERLDPPPVAMGGEWDTVFATSHAAGISFAVTGASVARYVFDCADWDAGAWIVPCGASGDPDSPHFADQRAPWAAGELVPMRYDWERIAASASARTTLTPA